MGAPQWTPVGQWSPLCAAGADTWQRRGPCSVWGAGRPRETLKGLGRRLLPPPPPGCPRKKPGASVIVTHSLGKDSRGLSAWGPPSLSPVCRHLGGSCGSGAAPLPRGKPRPHWTLTTQQRGVRNGPQLWVPVPERKGQAGGRRGSPTGVPRGDWSRSWGCPNPQLCIPVPITPSLGQAAPGGRRGHQRPLPLPQEGSGQRQQQAPFSCGKGTSHKMYQLNHFFFF